ncbi:MAG: DUF4389 domain-containing protein [Gammaproteobacteria bacterium]|nr:DUF4389 domain-containing protein [Gammaproteobacteria bacterium]
MPQSINDALKDGSTWKRIISMLVLGFAYGVAETVLIALVIAQVVFRLVSGNTNEGNGKKGGRLYLPHPYVSDLQQRFPPLSLQRLVGCNKLKCDRAACHAWHGLREWAYSSDSFSS